MVTVYIPTHNRAGLCERAIRSALAQTEPSLEVIVVDDGSCDDTPTRLQKIAKLDARIRIFRQDAPQGACAARNRALKEARGTYCTGLDDDDELAPEHVSRLHQAFDSRYAFVAPSLVEIGSNGSVPYTVEAGSISLGALLHYNRVGPQVFTTVNRMREVGGYDETFPALQDYDLWVRLVARFGPGLRTADPTYRLYTDHGGTRISASSTRRLHALSLFEQKHGPLMAPEHRKTMQLHAIKYSSTKLGFVQALRLICPGNAKMVAAMLANGRLPALQRAVHFLRAMKNG